MMKGLCEVMLKKHGHLQSRVARPYDAPALIDVPIISLTRQTLTDVPIISCAY